MQDSVNAVNLSVCDEVIVTSDTSSNSYNCCVWEIDSGSILEAFEDGKSGPNCLAAIGSDYIISSIKGTNVLKIWPGIENSQAGGLDIVCPDSVLALDVSRNSIYCAGAIDCQLYLWQVYSGKLISILSMHVDEIRKVKFTNDEEYIISSGMDSMIMAWKILDIFNAKDPTKVKPFHIWRVHPDGVMDFTVTRFASENKVIAIGISVCKVYSVESGECLMSFESCNESPFTSVAVDVLGRLLFIGKTDGCVLQLEPDFTPKENLHHKTDDCPMKTLNLHKLIVTCLATSMDGTLLVSGSADNTVVVSKISTSQVLHVLSHNGTISNLFFIPRPSPYSNISRKIIKPFQFEISSFSIDEWKIPLNPVAKSKITWDEKVYGKLKVVEDAAMTSGEYETEKLTEKKIIKAESINELLFTFGSMD